MRTWQKISILLLVVGWFAFMWLAAFGMRCVPEMRFAISMFGLFICFFGVFGFISTTKDSFWYGRDRLYEEKQKYWKARKQCELRTNELVEEIVKKQKTDDSVEFLDYYMKKYENETRRMPYEAYKQIYELYKQNKLKAQ